MAPRTLLAGAVALVAAAFGLSACSSSTGGHNTTAAVSRPSVPQLHAGSSQADFDQVIYATTHIGWPSSVLAGLAGRQGPICQDLDMLGLTGTLDAYDRSFNISPDDAHTLVVAAATVWCPEAMQ